MKRTVTTETWTYGGEATLPTQHTVEVIEDDNYSAPGPECVDYAEPVPANPARPYSEARTTAQVKYLVDEYGFVGVLRCLANLRGWDAVFDTTAAEMNRLVSYGEPIESGPRPEPPRDLWVEAQRSEP